MTHLLCIMFKHVLSNTGERQNNGYFMWGEYENEPTSNSQNDVITLHICIGKLKHLVFSSAVFKENVEVLS